MLIAEKSINGGWLLSDVTTRFNIPGEIVSTAAESPRRHEQFASPRITRAFYDLANRMITSAEHNDATRDLPLAFNEPKGDIVYPSS